MHALGRNQLLNIQVSASICIYQTNHWNHINGWLILWFCLWSALTSIVHILPFKSTFQSPISILAFILLTYSSWNSFRWIQHVPLYQMVAYRYLWYHNCSFILYVPWPTLNPVCIGMDSIPGHKNTAFGETNIFDTIILSYAFKMRQDHLSPSYLDQKYVG